MIFNKYIIGYIFLFQGLASIFNYIFIRYPGYRIFAFFINSLIAVFFYNYLFFAIYKHKITSLYEKKVCFDDTFNHSGIGMTLTTLDGAIIRTNKSFCDILGYSEEVEKLSYKDITYEDDLEGDINNVKNFIRGKTFISNGKKIYL